MDPMDPDEPLWIPLETNGSQWQGITISGDDKIKTLGTLKAVYEVNISHLAKKLGSQLEKKTRNPSAPDLKIEIGNNLLDFFKYRPIRFEQNLEQLLYRTL